jgi:hypothetical protein
MAAAHLSDARNIQLQAAGLTLCGYQVKGDAIGGTMTPAQAILVMETELSLAESELQTDHEPVLRYFDTAGVESGPYKEEIILKKARALAIAHG